MEKLSLVGLAGVVAGYMLCLARFKIKAAAQARVAPVEQQAKAVLAQGMASVDAAAAQVEKKL